MATTSYFEETVKDSAKQEEDTEFEIGRTSFTGENLIYIRVDGRGFILNEETGKRLVEAVHRLGTYLSY